jgi:protein TonB
MRRSFTLCSVVVHSIVIAAALYAQILADSSLLPLPHKPMMFDAGAFMPVNVQLPRPRAVRTATTADAVSENAAPVIAPEGVSHETGREGDPLPSINGPIAGVESGPPSAIEGTGTRTIAPPPPAEPVAPIRLHSGMKAPVKITDVAPVYPGIARSAHIQGVVILEAVLDAQGRVESVRVLRSIPLLDQAAVEAVQHWRFTPALLNGEPVPVVMTVTVNFALRE